MVRRDQLCGSSGIHGGLVGEGVVYYTTRNAHHNQRNSLPNRGRQTLPCFLTRTNVLTKLQTSHHYYIFFSSITVHTQNIPSQTMHATRERPMKVLHPSTPHHYIFCSSHIHPSHSTLFKHHFRYLQSSEHGNTSSEQASGTDSDLSSSVGDLDGWRGSGGSSVGRWDGCWEDGDGWLGLGGICDAGGLGGGG